jgi:hypothetical protein
MELVPKSATITSVPKYNTYRISVSERESNNRLRRLAQVSSSDRRQVNTFGSRLLTASRSVSEGSIAQVMPESCRKERRRSSLCQCHCSRSCMVVALWQPCDGLRPHCVRTRLLISGSSLALRPLSIAPIPSRCSWIAATSLVKPPGLRRAGDKGQ